MFSFSVSDDMRDLLRSFVSFVGDSAKIVLASLFSVFVPQRCLNRVDTLCTLEDNVTDLQPFNQATLMINVVTLISFIATYSIEFGREKTFISDFDFSDHLPVDHLVGKWSTYPQQHSRMQNWNRAYMIATSVTCVLTIINTVMSAVLIWGMYYLDYRSVTVFCTNVLLIIDRLWNAYHISEVSTREDVPTSAFLNHPLVFNDLDKNIRVIRCIRFRPSPIHRYVHRHSVDKI